MRHGIQTQQIGFGALLGGGISAFYKCAQKYGYLVAGVKFDPDWNLKYYLVDGSEIANDNFYGSKYTAAATGNVFREIRDALDKNESVFFAGTPCQVAGLKAFVGQKESHLVTADLICHGVCSNVYLKQHIHYIENLHNKKVTEITFRDPKYGTESYHFTAYNDNCELYSKTPNDDDVYQVCYHRAISYRESCYHCKYSCGERVGDLTFGDYWGLGRKVPFEFSKDNVSLIMINSCRGEEFLQQVVKEGFLEVHERPLYESFSAQGALNRPSYRSFAHVLFKRKYGNTCDFERAGAIAVAADNLFNRFHLNKIDRIIRKCMMRVLN